MRRTCIAWILTLAGAAAAAEPGPPVADMPARIVDTALSTHAAYEKLAWLTDRIGHRLSGSPQYAKAVAWTAETMRQDGLDRVWTEPVKVPHWVRGVEHGRILAPAEHRLAIMALGMSDPTPPEGITAEVVVVASLDELKARASEVKGKIVLFNAPIERNGSGERGYGFVAGMRHRGAPEAAKLGAVGMLIRSLGTADYRLPHTGSMDYEDGVPRIPAAAIAAEDAALIARLVAAGEAVKVTYTLGCKNLGEADSANVLADLRGREKPDEIVLIGAHLDSWDAGTGATDDGTGVAAVMETMRLLKSLGTPPRRTIRAVLFANEENGLRGGKAYAEAHAAEMARHVAAIETDSGGGRPTGFGVSAGPGAVPLVSRLVEALAGIAADDVREGGGGADISTMIPYGVPQLGMRQETTHYFDYHHSDADTLDKVDPHDLAMHVAALATLAYGLADMEGTLPRLPPPKADDKD